MVTVAQVARVSPHHLGDLVSDPPELSSSLKATTDDIIDSLVCPPPPSDNVMNEDIISSLIVPAPGYSKFQTTSTTRACYTFT